MSEEFKKIELGHNTAFIKVSNKNAIVYVPSTKHARSKNYYLKYTSRSGWISTDKVNNIQGMMWQLDITSRDIKHLEHELNLLLQGQVYNIFEEE